MIRIRSSYKVLYKTNAVEIARDALIFLEQSSNFLMLCLSCTQSEKYTRGELIPNKKENKISNISIFYVQCKNRYNSIGFCIDNVGFAEKNTPYNINSKCHSDFGISNNRIEFVVIIRKFTQRKIKNIIGITDDSVVVIVDFVPNIKLNKKYVMIPVVINNIVTFNNSISHLSVRYVNYNTNFKNFQLKAIETRIKCMLLSISDTWRTTVREYNYSNLIGTRLSAEFNRPPLPNYFVDFAQNNKIK